MSGIQPERYRKVVLVAGLALAAIVLTGAAVRLTEAGLGCENWPSCSEERFVPEWGFHAWIEFGNRLVSGVVAVAAAAAVLMAYRRRPRRNDLILWAWGLVAGVAAQIVLGGITVLVDLHPLFVAVHFLLSMILLWNAVVLWVKSGAGGNRVEPAVPPGVINLGRAVVVFATGVLISGTLVTGTGPNGGDSRAERLSFDLVDIARVHSAIVWCFLALTVWLLVRLRANRATIPGAITWLLAAILAQGAVGYLQYAMGVPPALVELHILGAIAVWGLSILAYLGLFNRPDAESIPVNNTTLEPERVISGAVFDKMKS